MELKVWVEGIQRVVCGVSEATTCQDVVVALAHATGKTGRFTLIEKWRDTERLLAPADYPLKALHKWGEYSSEVVFVLKHSDKHRKERSSKRTDKFSHNFSPHSPFDASGTPSKGLKKSLTFSGAHSYPKSHLTAVRRQFIQDNSSLESIDDQSSVTSQSQSSISTMSPYGSLEKRHHRHRGHGGNVHHNNNNKLLYGSIEKHKTKAHRLKSPSPFNSSSHYSQQSPRSENTPNGSLERQRNSSPYHSPHELTPKIEQQEEYDLEGRLPGNIGGAVNTHRLVGSKDFTKLNGSVNKDAEFHDTSPAKERSASAEKEDLAKLIKLQQEKLSIQASQIKVLDQEIQYLETVEKECDRQAAQAAVELESVQRKDAEVDNELQELDIVSWADKLEIEKQNQKTLQSEITLMRSRLSNCETELLQHKNKSLLLPEDVEKERKELLKQEQEQKEQEIKILQDISEVQKQLNEKLVQYEKNQEDIEELQNEVKQVESCIFERKTRLAQDEKELREVNMEIFMKVPNSLEGSSSALNRLSPSRPGSARKMMYSPVLLKEAVATTTNPHGLWV